MKSAYIFCKELEDRCACAVILVCLLIGVISSGESHAQTIETVFYNLPEELVTEPIPEPSAQLIAVPGYPNDPAHLTLVAHLYLPDPLEHGPGPYPTVLVLHGSGGLWSNDVIANGLISQFEQWGEMLAELGYACLLPDSYNPRGIPENFESRRPHHNPLIDDALCSPNYERPKDVIASMRYLQTRPEIDMQNTAIIGFSHGAQTGINAVLDSSVDLVNYVVSYIDLVLDEDTMQMVEDTISKPVPSPVRLPQDIPFPKLCVFYYGGGSHFGYHGDATSTAAGRYMFDRRTKVLMFHGTSDSLLGVSDPDASPLTGNLYPMKQALASSNQAASLGLPNPLKHHFLFSHVGHSFDLVTSSAEIDWNTPNESDNQKAKRLAREEVLKWLELVLKPMPTVIFEEDELVPSGLVLSASTNSRLQYRWQSCEDLSSWQNDGDAFIGSGTFDTIPVEETPEGRNFYKLNYEAIPPPIDAPENVGFFLSYDDFSY